MGRRGLLKTSDELLDVDGILKRAEQQRRGSSRPLDMWGYPIPRARTAPARALSVNDGHVYQGTTDPVNPITSSRARKAAAAKKRASKPKNGSAARKKVKKA